MFLQEHYFKLPNQVIEDFQRYDFLVAFYICMMKNPTGIIRTRSHWILDDIFGIKTDEPKKIDPITDALFDDEKDWIAINASGIINITWYDIMTDKGIGDGEYALIPYSGIYKFKNIHKDRTRYSIPKLIDLLRLYCVILSKLKCDADTDISPIYMHAPVKEVAKRAGMPVQKTDNYIEILKELDLLGVFNIISKRDDTVERLFCFPEDAHKIGSDKRRCPAKQYRFTVLRKTKRKTKADAVLYEQLKQKALETTDLTEEAFETFDTVESLIAFLSILDTVNNHQ